AQRRPPRSHSSAGCGACCSSTRTQLPHRARSDPGPPRSRASWAGARVARPGAAGGSVGMSDSRRSVYVVVSAAPPVLRISEFIIGLQARRWQVSLIATPTAATWIDLGGIASATGCVTRVAPRSLYEPDTLPPADALVAAPLTFNTLNKWAAGISDTLALGLLNEGLGLGLPIIAAPVVKAALRRHPAYSASIATLRGCGVQVLDPDAIAIRLPD